MGHSRAAEIKNGVGYHLIGLVLVAMVLAWIPGTWSRFDHFDAIVLTTGS